MPRIAVLTSRFPFPLEKGDKLRIFNQIKSLSENNEVHLICLNDKRVTGKQREALNPFCASIHIYIVNTFRKTINLSRSFFQDIPLQVGLFYSSNIRNKIDKLLDDINPDAVYCHLIRMSEYVRHRGSGKKIIDYMDAFSLGMKRRAAVSSALVRPLFLLESNRLMKYEREVFNDFNEHVIISGQDRDAISHTEKDKIKVIPNGVDFSVFYPEESKKKYDLLFTGNMGYPPNIESAYFAATKILPLIHKTNPGVSLLIAGIDAPQKIKRLGGKNIFVIEKFDHIRDAFIQSGIMLAPMLISIGLQNKILQAMAMKIPTIASSLANKAIGANASEIMEANTPQEFARACISLLEDHSRYTQLQENAFAFVKKNYDWSTHNEQLEKIILH
jgi:glycosyltransferase involved in cell wall biosynthesis